MWINKVWMNSSISEWVLLSAAKRTFSLFFGIVPPPPPPSQIRGTNNQQHFFLESSSASEHGLSLHTQILQRLICDQKMQGSLNGLNSLSQAASKLSQGVVLTDSVSVQQEMGKYDVRRYSSGC